MTSNRRGISRALIVLALSGAGTGVVGAVSISAHADGLPNPAPLPTTDPLPLPGGVTDPLPLPGASDSPSPQPSDSSSTDTGGTTDNSSTGSSSTDTSTGQVDTSQSNTGSGASGAASNSATTTKQPSGRSPVTSTGVTKGVPVTSAKVSTSASGNLVTTAGQLTQGATVPKLSAPNVAVPAPMTPLLHALSLPDLPSLPGLVGSAGAAINAQAPIVAAAPMTGGAGAVAGGVPALPYTRTSSSTPSGQRSPVAPALFALVAAAVAAGVAKVRIRWGRG